MRRFVTLAWITAGSMLTLVGLLYGWGQQVKAAAPPPELLTLCWVAYAPTNFNPNIGDFPSEAEIRADLKTLRAAGFNGLVTYGSDGSLGTLIPRLAWEEGFSGLIMGIWNPVSTEEVSNAATAAANPTYGPVVVGFGIGNEGLNARYTLPTLEAAINGLRAATGKPLTTTERWADYFSIPAVATAAALGDWIFPNVHPYYANPPQTNPATAVAWTEARYNEFQVAFPGFVILFKEVGLPSAGATSVNPLNQAEYYRQLWWDTDVQFAYFEAFDQFWKTFGPVEPYWGLFTKNRVAKAGRDYACGGAPGVAPNRNYYFTSSQQLTWNRITYAIAYEVQVDDAPTFAAPYRFTDTIPPNQLSVTTSLTNGRFYWRVRAKRLDGTWGAWSLMDNFIVSIP